MRELNAGAVITAITDFGLDGPCRPARDRPHPAGPVGWSRPTWGAGAAAADGRRPARRVDDEDGVLVEAPMISAALSVAAEIVIEHSAYGVDRERAGNRSNVYAPQGIYPPPSRIRCALGTDAGWPCP